MYNKFVLGALMSCFLAILVVAPMGTAQAAIADDVAAAMAANPDGGPALAAAIADIVAGAEDPVVAAQEVVTAAEGLTLNAAQRSAVGTGIGQAANIVGLTDPAVFARIAGFIAGTAADIQVAFDIATGNPTGAIDPNQGLVISGPSDPFGTISAN